MDGVGGIEIGKRISVNKNLKSGYIVGKIKRNEKIVYIVRLIDFVTKKIIGDFIYTEKQITVIG